jgi:polyphosphate kinase
MKPEKQYIHREMSLLEFNRRVLAQAMDESNPPLERLKFCGIVSSNLDEFYMVRVPRLEFSDPQFQTVRDSARELLALQREHFTTQLVPLLEESGIRRLRPENLDAARLKYARTFFDREVLPALTPMALRPGREMAHLSNLDIYFLAALRAPKGRETRFAAVEIPPNLPRLVTLPAEQGFQFMLLEDIVGMFARDLFLGHELLNSGLVRLTRASELELTDEADANFIKAMESALKQRRKGRISRLELAAPPVIADFLKKALNLSFADTVDACDWMDIKGISQLAFQPGFEPLKRKSWKPRNISPVEQADDVWKLLRSRDVLLHLPYESFDAFKTFLSAAAQDPSVLAIKQTLYRVGSGAAVPAILEQAATRGKQVTVLVELMARFDEENNIAWAKKLEAAGANVIYGVAGLKTHAKACLVVRREDDGIRRYAHLGTGNYNEKTARLYGDIGLFTAREDITSDVASFFNMITGYSEPAPWSKIEAAPYGLRRKLIRLINREAANSTAERPGRITAKMNSLVDRDVIDALYAASKAGVKIRLNVRGICCLRPGVRGLSENIEVVSIVDMFLEHSRILHVHNRGNDEVYLSSADWMPRNLDRRLELMFTVDDRQAKREIIDILSGYFKDNTNAWLLKSDGHYERLKASSSKTRFRAQEYLCSKAREREQQQAIPHASSLVPLKAPKLKK